jgi:branched-chain amino acid aminotransferase
MSQFVYLNGSLIPRSQANISAIDYGFLFGFGLFETMRSYNGWVFRLDRHLSRLTNSAVALGLSLKAPELKGAIMDAIQANKLGNARIRITVSPGEGGMTPDLGSCKKPTILVMAEHYKPYPPKVYRKGFSVVISSIRRNSQSPLSQLKSTSYLESILVKQEARAAGVDEALRLNEKGFLAEAGMSNIFLVSGGTLKTPGLESGILPGITREAVLELASQMDISSLEQEISPDELFQAEEIFLTNSLIEVMPLTEIDSRPVASGKPGPVTRRLMAAYKRLVLTEEKAA